jgi:hypothetical protein
MRPVNQLRSIMATFHIVLALCMAIVLVLPFSGFSQLFALVPLLAAMAVGIWSMVRTMYVWHVHGDDEELAAIRKKEVQDGK